MGAEFRVNNVVHCTYLKILTDPVFDHFQAVKCGIVESVLNWMKAKQQVQMGKKMTATKTAKLKGIPKLDDANDAGTK